MKIVGRKEGYSIVLDAGEKIEISINNEKIYEYIVPVDNRTEIGYSLHTNSTITE